MPSIFFEHPYLSISAAAFLVNIPLGYLRENCPKFSFKWFLWIHASIPLIIYLRITLGTSKLFIPVAIYLAIVGQVMGSRYRRKNMTIAEHERLEQVSSLNLPAQAENGRVDSKTAVVLMNMGGPDNLEEVKPFLTRLFLDSRIIRVPLSFLFQKLFAKLIVALRYKEVQKRYALIGGGSPIFASTQKQAQALESELKKRGRDIAVTFCFNYSRPLPDEVVSRIKGSGRPYVLPLSLYPHYSEATTGSNLHYLNEELAKSYPQAKLLSSQKYYLDENYIAAFVDRICEALKPGERLDDFYLMFSTHGLPLYFLMEGDIYPFEIAQTVAKVLSRLNRDNRWVISYQSAVGPFQWLKPSTDAIIKALAHRGEKKILVVPISFVTDHIETTCEIDIEYRAVAQKLGVSDFRMSRALECHPLFIKTLADCVEKSLGSNK